MPFTIAHATQAVGTDAGNGEIRKAQWNENHTPTFTSSFLRNRIINGDMRIDQRNEGASQSFAGGNAYTLDRWQAGMSVVSKFTVQKNAGSVTPPAGFTDYLGVTITSAYTPLSTDSFGIQHNIEGFNVSDLDFGKSTAKTVTLSFWIRSSLTGTFGGSIFNSAFNRSYPFSYSISAANTWEQKTVTISGDTSGTWLTTSGIGLTIYFALGAGSSLSGSAGAWSASGLIAPTGSTNVVSTNGATFYLTGVQLEVGSVATAFERRPYGQEMYLCQRYYQKTYEDVVPATATTSGLIASFGAAPSGFGGGFTFPVPLRASPTFSYWDGAGNASKTSYYNAGWVNNNAFYSSVTATKRSATLVVNVGVSASLFIHYTAEAEL